MKAKLDGGHKLPFPDGILINGHGPNGAAYFTVEQGTFNFLNKLGTVLTSNCSLTIGILIVYQHQQAKLTGLGSQMLGFRIHSISAFKVTI